MNPDMQRLKWMEENLSRIVDYDRLQIPKKREPRGIKGFDSLKNQISDYSKSFENFGIGGLLGHYFSKDFNKKSDFNLDFSRGRFDWNPNDKWNFYAQPDTVGIDDGIPEFGGIKIGGSYKF